MENVHLVRWKMCTWLDGKGALG